MPDTNTERIRLLSLVDILEPLSEEEIERLNGQLPDRRLQKGEVFSVRRTARSGSFSAEGQGQDLQNHP